MFSDITLATSNWPCWEYLPSGAWLTLRIRLDIVFCLCLRHAVEIRWPGGIYNNNIIYVITICKLCAQLCILYVSNMYHKLHECTPRHMHSAFWGRAWRWTHTCIITVHRPFVKGKASCKGKGQLLLDCGYQKWWRQEHSLWPSFSPGISGIVEFCDPRKVVIACRCTVNAKGRWLKFCSYSTFFFSRGPLHIFILLLLWRLLFCFSITGGMYFAHIHFTGPVTLSD